MGGFESCADSCTRRAPEEDKAIDQQADSINVKWNNIVVGLPNLHDLGEELSLIHI